MHFSTVPRPSSTPTSSDAIAIKDLEQQQHRNINIQRCCQDCQRNCGSTTSSDAIATKIGNNVNIGKRRNMYNGAVNRTVSGTVNNLIRRCCHQRSGLTATSKKRSKCTTGLSTGLSASCYQPTPIAINKIRNDINQRQQRQRQHHHQWYKNTRRVLAHLVYCRHRFTLLPYIHT